MKILLLPGITGSSLVNTATGRFVWGPGQLDAALGVAAGNVSQLALAPDGSSVLPIVAGYVLEGYFDTLAGRLATLRPADQIIQVGYDWRRPWSAVAAGLLPMFSEPCVIVAHSMGGAIALSLWAQLVAAGNQANFAGVFFVGCPLSSSLGNAAALQALNGLGRFFELLTGISVISAALQGGGFFPLLLPARLEQLLQTLTSFTALVSMIPVDQRLYDPTYWQKWSRNSFITGQGLGNAQLERANLFTTPLPAVRCCNVYASGQPTAYSYQPLRPLSSPATYFSSGEGDNVVLTAERYQGLPVQLALSNCDHVSMLEDPALPALIAAALNANWFTSTSTPIPLATLGSPGVQPVNTSSPASVVAAQGEQVAAVNVPRPNMPGSMVDC